MSKRTPVFTKNAPPPLAGVMNQAVFANGFVYCSGAIAADPATGKLIEGDVQAHTHRCIQNLGAVLEAAGSSLNDVVEVNVFLSDMANFGNMNEVYQTYWGDIKPCRTQVQYEAAAPLVLSWLTSFRCVAVKTLPFNTDVEIKCVGVVTKPGAVQSKL